MFRIWAVITYLNVVCRDVLAICDSSAIIRPLLGLIREESIGSLGKRFPMPARFTYRARLVREFQRFHFN